MDILELIRYLSPGDVVFCIVGAVLLYFSGEMLFKVVKHLSGIAESLFVYFMKFAFIAVILSMIFPLTSAIKSSVLGDIIQDERLGFVLQLAGNYTTGWFRKV
jgi:hypothetical protein